MKSVSRIIKKLLSDEPYYSLFLIGLNKRFKKCGSCSVSIEGINYCLNIDPDYWESLTEDQKCGALLHELLHICFFHIPDYKIWIAKYPNHKLLNIAMDCEIQSYLDEKYWDMRCSAEQLFKMFKIPKRKGTKYYWEFLNTLKNEIDNPGSSNSKKPNNEQQSDEEDYESDFSSQINQYNNMSNSDKQKVSELLEDKNNNHDWKELIDQIEQENLSDLIKSQTEYQMKEAAKNCTRGLWPAGLIEKLDELFKPKPPVFNWKAYFRRCLGVSFDIYQKKTRRKESKRFDENPGLKRKKKHKILIGIDTSGSVSSKEFDDFFSEVYHIYKSGADIHILECDAQICGEYDYKGKKPAQLHGRGGTSFLPVISWYNAHCKDYTACVYFTDGYGDQEECKPNGKMLWIITSDGNQESEYPGIKICIPKEN